MSLSLCGWLSFGIFAAGVVRFLRRRRNPASMALQNPIWYFILLTFCALVVLLFPLARIQYRDEAADAVLRFFLTVGQAIQNALRTFILDGSWSDFREAGELAGYPWYSFYGIALSILAPLLTFGMIFSLLAAQSFRFQLYFAQIFRRPIFIMSELSEASLVLSQSILEDPEIGRPKIIFTDVFLQEEEENYELRSKAKQIGAAFYKDDITEIRLNRTRGEVSFFLIGKNESENIEQALKLYQKQKNSSHIRLFVWSQEDANAVLLDSLKRGGILEYSKVPRGQGTRFLSDVRRALENGEFLFIRRIDNAMKTAWREVPEMGILRNAVRMRRDPAVLIVGRGPYAEAFFKTILWFCQTEEFCPEVTVIDRENARGTGGNRSVEDSMRERCPELLDRNRCREDGEAHYDCSFFAWEELVREGRCLEKNADGFFADVSGTFLADPAGAAHLPDRISRVRTVIISAEDDDENISLAMYFRTFFARGDLHPDIYAVVKDDRKAMREPRESGPNDQIFQGLRAYDNRPLDIHFIGNLSSLYDWKHVYNGELEERGWKEHNQWVDIEQYEASQDRWNYGTGYKLKATWEQTSESGSRFDYEEAVNLCKYQEKEYYRTASAGKAIHRAALIQEGLYRCENGFSQEGDPRIWNCTCEGCRKRRKVEHMRWNTYMRSIGYVYAPRKGDGHGAAARDSVAKTHSRLVPFADLPYEEKIKDS